MYVASNALRFLGGLCLLFYLEWRLAVVVCLVLPFMIISVRYLGRKIHTVGHELMERKADFSSSLQHSLSLASVIKAFSTEDREVKKLVSRIRSLFHVSLEAVTVRSVANVAISSIPDITRAFVLAAGAYWIIKDQWTIGSLLAFIAYLEYVFGPAKFLASANIQLENSFAALQRVSALFNILPENDLEQGKNAAHLKGEVELRNITFTYDGRNTVLDNVSFHVQAGQRLGIAGPSGAGKTTLLSLLVGFYRPNSGEVLFDGQPFSDYSLRSLRRRMGYVPQSTHLIAGTVLENISYGNREATVDEVVRAAKIAEIHQVIENLPHGYDTIIGEGGLNLSEGQKQRIALARALVKDPDIPDSRRACFGA